jgi:molecular chaperone GrpE (heat shock protein)
MEELKKLEQARKKQMDEFINALVKAGSKEYDKKMAQLRAELDQAVKDEKTDAAERIRAEIEGLKKAFEKAKTEGVK